MDVHNELGCGFLEKVYQEALAIVLKEDGIEFEREKHLPIHFRGTTLQCDYIADFVIENKVILELKAVSAIDSLFEALSNLSYLHQISFHFEIQTQVDK